MLTFSIAEQGNSRTEVTETEVFIERGSNPTLPLLFPHHFTHPKMGEVLLYVRG